MNKKHWDSASAQERLDWLRSECDAYLTVTGEEIKHWEYWEALWRILIDLKEQLAAAEKNIREAQALLHGPDGTGPLARLWRRLLG